MNFAIQEHIKHRITGIIVLLSIMLILLPALISKSNEKSAKTQHMSLQATINTSKEMAFVTKKLAPPVQLAENKSIVKPQSYNIHNNIDSKHIDITQEDIVLEPGPAIVAPKNNAVNKVVTTKAAVAPRVIRPRTIEPRIVAPQVVSPKVVVPKTEVSPVIRPRVRVLPRQRVNNNISKTNVAKKSDAYAVQLASFSEKQNAIKLTNGLRQRGYIATYKIVHERGHLVYKVVVGSMQNRLEAVQLQQKLAKATQLRGFIVQTEVV